MLNSEKVKNTRSDYPTPIKEALHILREIDYEQEIEEVKAVLSEDEKIRFANTPKIFCYEQHGCGGLVPYIRHEKKYYQRWGHNNGDHMSFLVLQDLWDDLQKDKRYVGHLTHPTTGKFLRESDRYPNKESERKFGICPGFWELAK